jgi:C1A family cysteine protease
MSKPKKEDGKEKEIREPKPKREPGEGEPTNPPAKESDIKEVKEGCLQASEGTVLIGERPEIPEHADSFLPRAAEIEEDDDIHAFGWKPSLPDFHDDIADVGGLRLSEAVDPRSDMPPVYDQGQLGSCTANAIAAALQYDCALDGEDIGVPSRLFIYYGERVREQTVLTDAGAYGRDGFKVLRKTGAPPEILWPYDISQFTVCPPEEAFEAAAESRIKHYTHPGLGQKVTKLDRKEAFMRVLSNRQTIAFGFAVFQSFEEAWEEEGVMPTPEQGEAVLGGHEVLLIGYTDDYPEHALCRNSWGEEWGLGGYFYMPWSFLCDPRYSADWRSIYREINA